MLEVTFPGPLWVFFFLDICFVRDLGELTAVCFVLHPGPVAQKVDKGIHLIKFNPLDRVIGFPNTYPLHSDLSGGLRDPAFKQPRPGILSVS